MLKQFETDAFNIRFLIHRSWVMGSNPNTAYFHIIVHQPSAS